MGASSLAVYHSSTLQRQTRQEKAMRITTSRRGTQTSRRQRQDNARQGEVRNRTEKNQGNRADALTLTLSSTSLRAKRVSCTAPIAWWPTRTKSLPRVLREKKNARMHHKQLVRVVNVVQEHKVPPSRGAQKSPLLRLPREDAIALAAAALLAPSATPLSLPSSPSPLMRYP